MSAEAVLSPVERELSRGRRACPQGAAGDWWVLAGGVEITGEQAIWWALRHDRSPRQLLDMLDARPVPEERGETELVDHVEALGRAIAHLQARQGREVSELLARREAEPVDPDRPFAKDPWRDACAQVALVLRLSPRAAENVLADGLMMRQWPATAKALATGRIDLPTVRAISEEAGLAGPEHRDVLEAAALAQAAEGRTARQVRMWTRKVAIRLDPAAAEQRAKAARADRGLTKTEIVDDMGELRAALTAEELKEVWDQVTTRAQRLPAVDGEGRPVSLDDRRATVLVNLVTHPETVRDCAHRDADRWKADLVMDVSTAMGDDESPAEMVGFGLLTAPLARRIAGGCTWRRLFTDPVTGQAIGLDTRRQQASPVLVTGRATDLIAEGIAATMGHRSTDRYRPTVAMRDHLAAVHRHCRFPGCRRPASACDVDHVTAHSRGGRTCICNLVPLCRFHHRVKHLDGWHITLHADYSVTWTTPTGHTYCDPSPRLRL